MSFLVSSEAVDKPCKDVLANPLQCFQELFFATPAVVYDLTATVGGFAVAVLIWGAIFALALFSILFVLKHLYAATKFVFTKTTIGQKISNLLPVDKYMEKLCCRGKRADPNQPKKLISTQAFGELGANIVSKVHVDSKWFKNALKHVPFNSKSNSDSPQRTETPASPGSPSKTPQRSTSRISALTPKILSPKSKQQ